MIAHVLTAQLRQVLDDFTHVLYMGDYCGVTVLTIVFSTTNTLLSHHSFVIPRVVALHDAGVPTFLHNSNQACGYVQHSVRPVGVPMGGMLNLRTVSVTEAFVLLFTLSGISNDRAPRCPYCSSTRIGAHPPDSVGGGGTSRTRWSISTTLAVLRSAT
jgi:hypothetical protein